MIVEREKVKPTPINDKVFPKYGSAGAWHDAVEDANLFVETMKKNLHYEDWELLWLASTFSPNSPLLIGELLENILNGVSGQMFFIFRLNNGVEPVWRRIEILSRFVSNPTPGVFGLDARRFLFWGESNVKLTK